MESLKPDQLRLAREAVGLTQQQAARRLAVSQAYIALMETGRRRVTAQLASKLIHLYRLGPTALPLHVNNLESWNSEFLCKAIANLGYPGFGRPSRGRRHNPAVILLVAITRDDLEVRIMESLPWLIMKHHNLDWEWLTKETKLRDAQNRLGFLVTLAHRIAEKGSDEPAKQKLQKVEDALNWSRLAREDNLCQASLSEAERRWLRKSRPADARHWNLLTDLNAENLSYAA